MNAASFSQYWPGIGDGERVLDLSMLPWRRISSSAKWLIQVMYLSSILVTAFLNIHVAEYFPEYAGRNVRLNFQTLKAHQEAQDSVEKSGSFTREIV